jgi:hypothetical protein
MQGKLARSNNKVLNKGTKAQMKNQPNDRPLLILEQRTTRAKNASSPMVSMSHLCSRITKVICSSTCISELVDL